MAFYNVVDHRAPTYLPHKSVSWQVDTARFGVNLFFLMVGIFGLSLFALGWLGLIWLIIPVMCIVYNTQYSRYVYPIKSNDHYNVDKWMTELKKLYQSFSPIDNPLEELMIGAYDAVRRGDDNGIYERLQLAREYKKEFPIAYSNPDIDDMRRNLETIRMMKKEGLL